MINFCKCLDSVSPFMEIHKYHVSASTQKGVLSMIRTAKLFCLVALASAALFSVSLAQISPNAFPPPRELEGEFQGSYVALDWHSPRSPMPPTGYNVYRSQSFTALPLPQIIGTTTDTSFNDSTINHNTLYFYFVTALYDTSQSFPSNFVRVFTGSDTTHDTSHVSIRFVSTPPHTGAVGQLWSYQAAVVTNPPDLPVCYSLHESPDGMTVSDSGLVQWTPSHPGIYEISLRARVCTSTWDGDGARQDFFVFVLSGPPGSIAGTVDDTAGNGIPHVKIKVFDVSHGEFVYSTRTDSTGHYAFGYVNPSTYYVHAEPDGLPFAPQWYDGASNIHDATPVVVADSQSVAVNFVLHLRDTVHHRFTISGFVLDSADHGIGGASVLIFRTDHDSASPDLYDDDHHDDHDPSRVVLTDSTGAYSVTVSAGTFILGAFAHGYVPQFWNHEPDPLDADRLVLTGDTSGIDFNLSPKLPATGSISGVILSGKDSSALHSHVIGFHKDGFGHCTGFVVSTRTDSTGSYTLNHLPDGSYIILALSGEDFIPTFYNLSGGTPFLDSATSVVISGGAAVTGIDIYAIPDTIGGLTCLKGFIHGMYSGEGLGTQTVTPLSGAIVTIANAAHQVVGATVSNQDGSYLVAGIPPGSFSAYFQKPGMTTSNSTVALSYLNNAPTTTSFDAQLNAAPGGGPYTVMNIQPRWNLVSVPVTVADLHRSALFPSATSDAFAFNGSGYSLTSTLNYGQGYWINYPSASSLIMNGTSRNSETITLTEGWNLVGSTSASVPAGSVTTSPSNILTSYFFSYGGGYTVSPKIDPGKGYWVKSSSGGTLTIASTGASAKTTAQDPLSQMNSLTMTDAVGNSQTLYFGAQRSDVLPQLYELPPVGPQGSFDARFASQHLVEMHPAMLKSPVSFPILVQPAQTTLTIRWTITSSSATYKLVDGAGKTLATLSNKGSTRISGTGGQIILSAQPHSIPKTFALYQNYPNPFNPSTQISFDLPATSTVVLKVFNILGQEVATLINNETMEAGNHTLRFDGANLGTGIYFYKIQAGIFNEVRKMVLVK